MTTDSMSSPEPAQTLNGVLQISLLAFYGFLLCQLVSGGRILLINSFGDEANSIGRVALAASVVLGLAATALRVMSGTSLCKSAQYWVFVNIVLAVSLFVYGCLGQGYSVAEATRDLSGFLLAIGFVVLGARPEFWRFISARLTLIFAIALVVNAFAMRDFEELIDASWAGERVARDSLSYRTQNLLDYWPILLLLSPYGRGWQRWVTAFGVVFVFGQQILFQKRIEIAFVIVVLVVYWFVWGWKTWRPQNIASGPAVRVIRHICLIAVAGTVVALVAAGPIIVSQAKSLISRFQGLDQPEYSHGFLSPFTQDNERLQIAIDCFTGFDTKEWIIGRGMGGAYPWTGFDMNLLQTERAEETYTLYYLPDVDYWGRRGLETGVAMPVLKGGLVFALSFYWVYLLALRRIQMLRTDRFAMMCLTLSVLWLGYTLMGGNFSPYIAFQMFCMYAPLGWCLSRYASTNPLVTSQPVKAGTAS